MAYARRALAATFPRGIITRYGVNTTDTYSQNGDIDWIAVERAANGDYEPTLLNDDERREAALLMYRSGLRERAISTHLCIYERRIGEWAAAAGLLPPERICTIDDCGHLMAGKGLCNNHLTAKRKREKRTREAAKQLEPAA